MTTKDTLRAILSHHGLGLDEKGMVTKNGASLTLPEQLLELHEVVSKSDAAHAITKAEVVTLKASAKTAEARAVEIAAAQGVKLPAAADGDKSAGKTGAASTGLTGLAAVERMYAKYETRNQEAV